MTAFITHFARVCPLAFLFPIIASAQITITQADMPISSDTLRYSTASATGTIIDLSQNGVNQTWDYSTLTPRSQARAEYKSGAQINIAYAFVFAGAYGRKVADSIGAGPIVAKDVYDFYRRTSRAFSKVGRGLSFSGLPLPAIYSDIDTIYRFPLNYQNRDSGAFKVTFSIPGIGSLIQAGTRANSVDAWGSITTPFGTFNCLRVRTVVREIDTLRATQLPFPIPFATNTVTYSWLAVGQRYPILEVTANLSRTGAETITGINYRDVPRQLAVQAPQVNFFALRRNIPVGDSVFFFNASTPAAAASSWSVTPNANFYFGAGTTATSRNPVMVFTAPGLYSIGLNISNSAGTADSTFPNYVTVTDPTTSKPSKLSSIILLNSPSANPALLLPAGQYMLLATSLQGSVQEFHVSGGRSPIYLGALLQTGSYYIRIFGQATASKPLFLRIN